MPGGWRLGPERARVRVARRAGRPARRRSNYAADVERRRLGRTEHRSSVAVLGGAAFWGSNPEAAGAAFTAAVDAGVNHLDVAPQYGRAEELLGLLVRELRERLFVGCKTMRHSRDGVRAQLETSLELLGCEQFDLYQLHAVTSLEELESRAGAVRALMEAKDEGLCRFIGITGHELAAPEAHLEALRRYDLDTVMFPINRQLWSDRAYRKDAEDLLALAEQRDVGVMAIKTAAARPWGAGPRTATTWYEPYFDPEQVRRSVRFTLSVPGVHALCTPGDLSLLPIVLQALAGDTRMDEVDREREVAAVSGEESIFPMPAT